MIDMGLKLKCLREHRCITQKELSRLSKVGEKTISSFETGQRLVSLKVAQLIALLDSLGVTLAEFIVWNPQLVPAPIETPMIVETLPDVVQMPPRRSLPVDPLAGLRSPDDSRFPSPQSPLARAM